MADSKNNLPPHAALWNAADAYFDTMDPKTWEFADFARWFYKLPEFPSTLPPKARGYFASPYFQRKVQERLHDSDSIRRVKAKAAMASINSGSKDINIYNNTNNITINGNDGHAKIVNNQTGHPAPSATFLERRKREEQGWKREEHIYVPGKRKSVPEEAERYSTTGPTESATSLGVPTTGPAKSVTSLGVNTTGPAKSVTSPGVHTTGPATSLGVNTTGPAKSATSPGVHTTGPVTSLGVNTTGPAKSATSLGVGATGHVSSATSLGKRKCEDHNSVPAKPTRTFVPEKEHRVSVPANAARYSTPVNQNADDSVRQQVLSVKDSLDPLYRFHQKCIRDCVKRIEDCKKQIQIYDDEITEHARMSGYITKLRQKIATIADTEILRQHDHLLTSPDCTPSPVQSISRRQNRSAASQRSSASLAPRQSSPLNHS